MSSLLCLNTATLTFVEAETQNETSKHEKNNKISKYLLQEESVDETEEIKENASETKNKDSKEELAGTDIKESNKESVDKTEEIKENASETKNKDSKEESAGTDIKESNKESVDKTEEIKENASETKNKDSKEESAGTDIKESNKESVDETEEIKENASETKNKDSEEESADEMEETKEELTTERDETLASKEQKSASQAAAYAEEKEVPPLPEGLYTLPLSEVFADPIGEGFPGVSSDGKILHLSDAHDQSGAIWSQAEISLKKSFETDAYVYFGDQGTSAADGITFTLLSSKMSGSKGQSTLGLKGQGLGIYGNSVEGAATIEMDTFYNEGESDGGVSGAPSGDGAKDHISFTQPSSVYTQGDWSDPKEYPVKHMQTKFVGSSLSDGEWKKFSVKWERLPGQQITGNFSYTLTWLDPETGEGYKEMTETNLLKIGLMEGSWAATPKQDVYWGFTGSTGGNGAKNAVAMSRLPESPTVTQKIEIKDEEGQPIKKDQVVPAGTILDVTVTNTAESGDIAWKDIVTTIDYSAFDNALSFVEGPEGKETTVSEDEGSVSFSATDTLAIGDSETLSFKLKAEEGTEHSCQLKAHAIGKNGLAESSQYFKIEKAAVAPITIHYVYDSTGDQELLPTMSSQTVTPEEGQTVLKISTDLTAKHFNYRGNSLENQSVNEIGELVIPFTDKEQTIYIRYEGQTWIESIEGSLAFKGKLQPAKQVLRPQESQIDLVVKSTAYQPNWQLLAKRSSFSGATTLPSKSLELLINDQEIGSEAMAILPDYVTSHEEHVVVGTTDKRRSDEKSLQVSLLVGTHSYRWAKKNLNYQTTITWSVLDNSVEQPSSISQALPLKGGQS